jgi:ferredoxin
VYIIYGGVSVMKAYVDKDACISCGLCPSICPEVFEMEDDGKAGVTTDSVPSSVEDSAKEAESSCPVNAISVS